MLRRIACCIGRTHDDRQGKPPTPPPLLYSSNVLPGQVMEGYRDVYVWGIRVCLVMSVSLHHATGHGYLAYPRGSNFHGLNG